MITHLEVGGIAPSFVTSDYEGNAIRLSDYKGKKVILYFYPRDSTPGCTAQACNLRDNYTDLQAQGFEVLGVSPDTALKHEKFIKKNALPFPLLMDTDLALHKAYGVWGEKKFMGRIYDGTHRTTFIIDEEGIIQEVIKRVKTKTHTTQILEALKNSVG